MILYIERVGIFHNKVVGFSNIRGIGINIVFYPHSPSSECGFMQFCVRSQLTVVNVAVIAAVLFVHVCVNYSYVGPILHISEFSHVFDRCWYGMA